MVLLRPVCGCCFTDGSTQTCFTDSSTQTCFTDGSTQTCLWSLFVVAVSRDQNQWSWHHVMVSNIFRFRIPT